MDKLTVSLIGTNDKKDMNVKQAVETWANIHSLMNMNETSVLEALTSNTPDIILLSIDVTDELLQKVIEQHGTRTILIANDDIYETKRIVYAIQLGIAQYVNIHPFEEIDSTLLQTKMKRVYRYEKLRKRKVNRKKEPFKQEKQMVQPMIENVHPTMDKTNIQTIIAIGTSTGGPRALEVVIRNLPKKLNVPILIVQHMPENFTKSLADRLNRIHNEIHVKEAEHLETLEKGIVYIAPGNYHMEVRKKQRTFCFHIHQEHNDSQHRPSVDVLFQSLALLTSVNKVAVILTGMGKDGAAGIKRMKQYDLHTTVIVEARDTVVVNGMPSAAIATNFATEVVPIELISQTMLKYIV